MRRLDGARTFVRLASSLISPLVVIMVKMVKIIFRVVKTATIIINIYIYIIVRKNDTSYFHFDHNDHLDHFDHGTVLFTCLS